MVWERACVNLLVSKQQCLARNVDGCFWWIERGRNERVCQRLPLPWNGFGGKQDAFTTLAVRRSGVFGHPVEDECREGLALSV